MGIHNANFFFLPEPNTKTRTSNLKAARGVGVFLSQSKIVITFHYQILKNFGKKFFSHSKKSTFDWQEVSLLMLHTDFADVPST